MEFFSVKAELCVKKRKEREEQKIEEKSPKSKTALGGGAYKQCKLPRFPFLGLATIAISRQLQYCAKSPKMADRRRINGPPGGTRPPVFASLQESSTGIANRAQRQRQPAELRKICMNRRQASC